MEDNCDLTGAPMLSTQFIFSTQRKTVLKSLSEPTEKFLGFHFRSNEFPVLSIDLLPFSCTLN